MTRWYNEKEDNSKGPLTVLPKLEDFTASWTNVKDQIYTMGAQPLRIMNLQDVVSIVQAKKCYVR